MSARGRPGPRRRGSLALGVGLAALAMGLGWGIRGQFGHQPGAMVPGALVGLALAWWMGRDLRESLRWAAVGAVATSVGGSMTYGQTIGLVQDSHPSPAYGWGLLGLGVKGAVWIGVSGLFVGMAAGGQEYRRRDVLLVGLLLAGMAFVGEQALNRPHDPARGLLPPIYFSNPRSPSPRQENWGGLWLALLCGMFAVRLFFDDAYAGRVSLFGCLAGGLGFPLGEVLQASGMHAEWLPEDLKKSVDWWKVMEVTFGAVGGAGLALGLWHSESLRPRLIEVKIPHRTRDLPALGAIGAWGAFLLAAGLHDGLSSLWDWPFIQASLLLPIAFSHGPGPGWIACGVTTWVSAHNVGERLVERVELQPEWLIAAVALALGLLAAAVPRRLPPQTQDARLLLIGVAAVQTALCLVKMLWPPGEGGAQVAIQLSFVVMTVGLALLTLRRPSPPIEAGTPSPSG